MAYRLNLNCADRVRFAEVASKLKLDGESLARLLIHDFFARAGVKNPSESTALARQSRRAIRV
jgi:hypothetical protein